MNNKYTGIIRARLTRYLSNALRRINLNNYGNKTKQSKILNTPFRYLPDCAEFRIDLGKIDDFLSSFGITRRTPAKIEITGGITKEMNRYLEHNVRRLLKARDTGNYSLYWHLSTVLLKRSNTFRVSAFQRVYPNWHREYPLHFICNVNRKVSNIINHCDSSIKSTRVYIPKANGTKRSLGVPSPEWRIYLHMLSNFLTLWIQPHISPQQHGFQPSKGTLTAWQDFFKRGLYKKRYIYEYDFKQFFDQVNIKQISRRLLSLNVPHSLVSHLEELNRTIPTITEAQTALDTQLKMREDLTRRLYSGERWTSDQISTIIKDLDIPYPSAQTIIESGSGSIEEYIQYCWAISEPVLGSIDIATFNRGVGQGYATSPILSMLVMEDWLRISENNPECVSPSDANLEFLAYADDSIVASDVEFTLTVPKDSTSAGYMDSFEIKESGSGWVKKDGKWLKPLKFLGLKFDGKRLWSETRSGRSLIFGSTIKHVLRLIGLKEEFQKFTTKAIEESVNSALPEGATTWEQMIKSERHGSSFAQVFKSKLIGFVQSRLYQGSWNPTEIAQDFTYTFIDSSWSDKTQGQMRSPGLNIFNSSSFACRSLCNIFRYKSRIRRYRAMVKATRISIN